MQPIKTPIFQASQIREIEHLAEERFGLTGLDLMQRAAKASLEFLLKRWPQARKISIFCGGGNNGGDGYTLAYLANERHVAVKIWQVGSPANLKDAAKAGMQACVQAGISIEPFTQQSDLGHPDVIVDAICGIGLENELRDEAVVAIRKINKSHSAILALDVPTGINADTGSVQGAALFATATVTFLGVKLGLLTGSGVAHAGELVASDLQLPPEILTLVNPVAEKIHLTSFDHYLKPRMRDWHKGLSGHVLIIGGDDGFSGAPRMAGQAALRVGAGLVSVATRKEHALVMNAACPELMCHGVDAAEELRPLVAKADVIILGPGLGQSEWAKQLWQFALEQTMPKVIDADGLNLLAASSKQSENWVLTPHPGEAARLLGESVQDIQQNRLAAVKKIQKRYGGVSVLKGAGSLVVGENGLTGLCDKGNPGMATAGMGDILSGVIGGLLAQHIPLGDAAKMAVSIHAKAGDLAAKEGERGMIATDLLPYLRRLSNISVQANT